MQQIQHFAKRNLVLLTAGSLMGLVKLSRPYPTLKRKASRLASRSN
jgi:hypothetical protein